MSEFKISYESEDFPKGLIQEPTGALDLNWSDLLWAALTVGRACWTDVWKHGSSSDYEAIFRCSLVKMAVTTANAGKWLHPTATFRNMDPSEKAAVNYFLGMIVCKLFATELLNTPWLLHLDVYHPVLHPVRRGKSRPDLVGQQLGKQDSWRAFECKGRFRLHDTTKDKAKAQATALVSVVSGTGRVICDLHVGAITRFQRDVLNFFWRDPEPNPDGSDNELVLSLPQGAWRYYYAPITNAIRFAAFAGEGEPVRNLSDPTVREIMLLSGERPLHFREIDIYLGVHPSIAELLFSESWDAAQQRAGEMALEFAKVPEMRADGLIVKAGPSWTQSHSVAARSA